jgi:hypothetical protein
VQLFVFAMPFRYELDEPWKCAFGLHHVQRFFAGAAIVEEDRSDQV